MKKTYTVAVIGSTGKGNYGHRLDTAFLNLDRAVIVAVADDDDAGLAQAGKNTVRLPALRRLSRNARRSATGYRRRLPGLGQRAGADDRGGNPDRLPHLLRKSNA